MRHVTEFCKLGKMHLLQAKIEANKLKGLRTRTVEFEKRWSLDRKIIELEEGVRLDRMNEIYRSNHPLNPIPEGHSDFEELRKLAAEHREYEEKYLNC